MRWDNVEITHWDAMGRVRKVGHDKSLIPLNCATQPLGTIPLFSYPVMFKID